MTRLLFVALVAALIAPNAALAQPQPDGAPAPNGTPSPDDLKKEPPPDPKFEEAKRRFLQGLALAEAGNCEGALAELEASLKLIERPSTLYNIARCNEKLFRYARAVEAYEAYLKIAAPDQAELVEVKATIRTLANLLATVDVKSNVRAEIWIGDQLVGKSPGTILVPGGRHLIELRAAGHLPLRKEVSVAGKEKKNLDFVLEEAKKEVTQVTQVTNVNKSVESRGLKPVYFWSGVAASGVALTAGVIFGIRAQSLSSDADDLDPRLPRESEKNKIDDAVLLADIFYATAGALAIGTTVLFFLTDFDDKEKAQGAALTVQPTVGRDGAGFVVGGRF